MAHEEVKQKSIVAKVLGTKWLSGPSPREWARTQTCIVPEKGGGPVEQKRNKTDVTQMGGLSTHSICARHNPASPVTPTTRKIPTRMKH